MKSTALGDLCALYRICTPQLGKCFESGLFCIPSQRTDVTEPVNCSQTVAWLIIVLCNSVLHNDVMKEELLVTSGTG